MMDHKKFEYRRELAPSTDTVEEALIRLNDLGAKGWQVANIATAPGHTKAVIWLMREKQ
jgi:hypothetical protein